MRYIYVFVCLFLCLWFFIVENIISVEPKLSDGSGGDLGPAIENPKGNG